MNKKIQEKLQDAVKDFGLSKEAIAALAESASKGAKDDISDEEVTKIVENFAEIAKTMQGEVTRKVQASKSKDTEHKVDDDKGKKTDENEPEWFKAYRQEQDEKLAALQQENDAFKAEKSKAERAALISETAKKLGIPDYLMKRVSLADDADVEKELGDYKQDLVNNSLLPKESGGGRASSDKEMQESAEAWAKNLPDASGIN